MRTYLQAPTSLGSGTKTTATTSGETLVPANDAPVDNAFTVILQPAGAYAVNVGYAANQTQYAIPQNGSLTLAIDQLSKIFVKTAQAGQGVNYIWYR